ncbi:hypothetical protein CHU98_g7447 [Xylaria longipes]|nr:hypothetical protein CHU98_g7447 [Xylaria longipes]
MTNHVTFLTKEFVDVDTLRTNFITAMSTMYGEEVPWYTVTVKGRELYDQLLSESMVKAADRKRKIGKGAVEHSPLTYEDLLPFSAAGISKSIFRTRRESGDVLALNKTVPVPEGLEAPFAAKIWTVTSSTLKYSRKA